MCGIGENVTGDKTSFPSQLLISFSCPFHQTLPTTDVWVVKLLILNWYA